MSVIKESETIKYSKGHKYQLKRDAWFQTSITGYAGHTGYVEIKIDGRVLVLAGYAWDGPSGPTIDTKSSMRGSLLHDALYQLIRFEILPRKYRQNADCEAFRRWLTDKMWKIRAWIWKKTLKKHAAAAAHPDHKRKIYTAP